MNKIKTVGAVVALLVTAVACEVFRDPSPEMVSVRVSGETGIQVRSIYSKIFTVGLDELGVTQVSVFNADTVIQPLPIDTIINIALERQFFIQVETITGDTLALDIVIDVDGANKLRKSGGIFDMSPFRFIFLFNRLLTDQVNVIL